jgi:hypothetical protein
VEPSGLLRRGNLKPMLLIPLNYLKSKIIDKGFANNKTQSSPKYLGRVLHLSDFEIVKYYNDFITKVLVYYKMADNHSSLKEFIYILEFSLAHTLAAKHRSTLEKTFKKYGKPIEVNSNKFGGKIKFIKPKDLNINYFNNKMFNLHLGKGKTEYNTKDPIK